MEHCIGCKGILDEKCFYTRFVLTFNKKRCPCNQCIIKCICDEECDKFACYLRGQKALNRKIEKEVKNAKLLSNTAKL